MKHLSKLAVIAALAAASLASAATINGYSQTNLVSDIPGLASHTDANLVNPWGISSSASSPFWVSNNGSGTTTLYNGSGTPQSLVVTIPSASAGAGTATGQVFNGSTSFNGDLFLFATEDGTISGWRGALGTTAELLLNQSSANAVYKGLAIATTSEGTYLYAADFHNNQITVLPGNGAPALAGSFKDPSLPAGFAPFNIQNLNGQLYVTYAKQDATGHDDVPAAGNGYVDTFDLNGNFIQRLVSNGPLDSPWGLAIAPASFGAAAGDLLVGNFGDGTINAFNLNGTFIGSLASAAGTPLVNDGLWGLSFGNGGSGGSTNVLYLTAGLNGESDGLFAQINAVPEPGSVALLAAGLGMILWRRRVRTSN